jgi:hypothetical protein
MLLADLLGVIHAKHTGMFIKRNKLEKSVVDLNDDNIEQWNFKDIN